MNIIIPGYKKDLTHIAVDLRHANERAEQDRQNVVVISLKSIVTYSKKANQPLTKDQVVDAVYSLDDSNIRSLDLMTVVLGIANQLDGEQKARFAKELIAGSRIYIRQVKNKPITFDGLNAKIEETQSGARRMTIEHRDESFE